MRNGSVDVYKFSFSLLIVFYHFFGSISPREHLFLASTAVELFVIFSGIFFFQSFDKKKVSGEIEQVTGYFPYHFVKKRVYRFLPYIIVAFLASAGVRLYVHVATGGKVSFSVLLTWLSKDIWELLFVAMNGLNNNSSLLNSPSWTVGAMVMVEFVVLALLVNNEKLFYTLICPLSILVGFGYWRHIGADINYNTWVGFTTFGVVRVFISTCLSWYSYKLMLTIKNASFTRAGKLVMTFLELFLFGFALVIILSHYKARNLRFLIILLFMLAAAISVSGVSYVSKLLPHSRVTAYLGELSLAIYLIHCFVWALYKHIWPNPHEMVTHVFSFILVVLVSACIFLEVVKYSRRAFKYLNGCLKAVLINSN